MSATELVIFDCDGVLVDSEVISNRVLARSLTREGLATTLTEARAEYQGLLLEEVLARAQTRLGRPLPEDWLARYERDRGEAFAAELEAVPGAAAAVRGARAAGVAVCVASQGKLAKMRMTLSLCHLDDLFEAGSLFSAESVARGKPHPDLFLHAAAEMKAKPAACLVVEDTPSGVHAAVAAGMPVLGYAADGDAAALAGAGAEVIHSLDQLGPRLGVTAPAEG